MRATAAEVWTYSTSKFHLRPRPIANQRVKMDGRSFHRGRAGVGARRRDGLHGRDLDRQDCDNCMIDRLTSSARVTIARVTRFIQESTVRTAIARAALS